MTAVANTTSVYPLAIVQAVLAAVVICLDIPPLIWHGKHGNFAASVLIFFILLTNFFDFINAIIWPNDNMDDWFDGQGLCDVEVKLVWAASTALPGAAVCILRKLARVMDTKNITISPTQAQKRRERLFEIAVCIGIPCLTMLFDFIVQIPRYLIVGISGCVASVSNTWASIILVEIPPLIITLWASYYAALISIRLRKYRARLDSLLRASNTNKTRFLRLFLLALTLIVFILPIQTYFLVKSWPSTIEPFVWSEIHNHAAYTEIPLIESFGVVSIDHWIHLSNGILVFLFFGLGKDATCMYRSWVSSIGLDKVASRVSSISSSLMHRSRKSTSASSAGLLDGTAGSSCWEEEKRPGVQVVKTVSSSSTASPNEHELGVIVVCT